MVIHATEFWIGWDGRVSGGLRQTPEYGRLQSLGMVLGNASPLVRRLGGASFFRGWCMRVKGIIN